MRTLDLQIFGYYFKPAAHLGTSLSAPALLCPKTFPNVPAAGLALVPCGPSWPVCELNSQLGPGDWESRTFACRRAVGDLNSNHLTLYGLISFSI